MKKTANLNAVPKKDSTAAESITLTSVDLHTPRPASKPLVGSVACRVSMSAKTLGDRVPCNPFYGKYSDLFPDNGISPSYGNLRDDLSSMHVVLHRRENVARFGLSRTYHIFVNCNPTDATHHRLLTTTYSNQIKNRPDHGFVNMPQSSLGATE